MTLENVKQLAYRYKAALIKNNIPVDSIYLFGSYAKGKQRLGSDIDFCVVSKIFGKNDFREMVLINQIAKRIASQIEAFPVSEKELKARNNPFITEALKTGTRMA
ncbi:MAG: nucleotidyltransferase domain-containing protein [Candidatus Omnitrophota bacterium]|nr:nucleotidyltransferase domain-containing protein [Candidatus Omnitrophota bacterium]